MRAEARGAWIVLLGALAADPARACAPGVAEVLPPVEAAPLARVAVEIADDPQERALGLMHRTALAPLSGMLFLYPEPAPRAFWMKDTLLPLDILYFDASGRLLNIIRSARPQDETPRLSDGAAQFVLEIAGGEAARLGIGAGARLRHPAIAAGGAAAPCGG